MSEHQLMALISRLREDAGLAARMRATDGLDDAVALAREAGFDVSKGDWIHLQAQYLELSEAELEGIAGGNTECCGGY
jgi:predicted ribosomally synthesized peptide with nif11-like leader